MKLFAKLLIICPLVFVFVSRGMVAVRGYEALGGEIVIMFIPFLYLLMRKLIADTKER